MRPFRAYSDLEHFESLLARTPGVKLVVLDPMELSLDERGQSISYGDRQTIRKLGELARRWGVAIVAAARVPDKPGANDLRRWLDKLAGVEELGALFAVVRDRRRPCRRYLAAVKNTLAEVEDALMVDARRRTVGCRASRRATSRRRHFGVWSHPSPVRTGVLNLVTRRIRFKTSFPTPRRLPIVRGNAMKRSARSIRETSDCPRGRARVTRPTIKVSGFVTASPSRCSSPIWSPIAFGPC